MAVYKIIFLALFVNNVALTSFLGIRPLGQAPKISQSLRNGLSIILMMLLSNSVLFIINQFWLDPFQLKFLQTIIFIIVYVSIISLLSFIGKQSENKFFRQFNSDMLAISTNSIILGICFLIFREDSASGFVNTIIYTVASGAGYLLVMHIIAGIAEHMRMTGVPKGMKGFPILLITIGILALAFIGLTGIFK
jgi:Na+-translocating ferredoxin:NAD+ oxidoreductase subunit A